MAAFWFKVNQAFLRSPGHPITVPRGQISYRALEAEGLNSKNITIIFPRGERFPGRLHYGEAGYGEYYQLYQLRIRGANHTPRYIRLDDRLLVALLKVSRRTYAVLEYLE